jgi:putative hydrolase of the HAD superfamily
MQTYDHIQAITFDVGGTLIQPHPSVGHVYAEIAERRTGQAFQPERLNRRFAAAWKARGDFQYTRPDWERLVDGLFEGMTDQPPSRTFFAELYDYFTEAAAWSIPGDVLPVLEELTMRGYRLAVVSNWDERLRPLLRNLKLDGFFGTIVVSCEVAFTKPSPVMFEVATHKLGVNSSELLHVGDSAVEDFEGARAAGLNSLLLDRDGAFEEHRRIASLDQLCALLPVR